MKLLLRQSFRGMLVAGCWLLAMGFSAAPAGAQMPPLPVAANRPVRPLYFSVVDVDTNGLSSSWSNELVWTNGGNTLTNLNWTAPVVPAGLVDHYVLYWGFQSRAYTYSRRLTLATNQLWPLPQLPAIWQKQFSYLSSTDLLTWSTNVIVLWTVTNNPPGNQAFYRSGPMQWKRLQ